MSDFLDLQARIEKLERRATSQRNLIIALFAACAVAATIATTEAQDHSVSFTDATTNNSVTLDANGLVFRDAAGGKRLELKAFSDGDGAVQIFDKSGARRMYLGFNADEAPTLMLDGTDGKPLIEERASSTPDTFYYDSSNNERVTVGLTTEGDGLMRFFGGDGKKLLSVEGSKQPFMRIYDANETERMWWGMTDTGDTGLEMFSPGHNERAYLGIYTDGKSGVAFYDANGAVVSHVP